MLMGLLWLFGSRVLWRYTLRGVSDEERSARLSKFNSTVLQRLLLFMYLVYPGVSITIISMFSCTALDHGRSFLNADFRITCWDRTHYGYVGLALLWTLLVPLGVPYAFMKLLHIFKVPQMARLKIDNAWLVEGVKEVWKRGAPQPTVRIQELNVESISVPHLEVMYAVLVKKASPDKAADILSGATQLDHAEDEDDVAEIAESQLRRLAPRPSAPLAPPRAKQLSLFRRARVRVEIWRIRVSAFLHPGGKNAAKLLVPPDSTAARRSFLLAAVLSWCKHSGELAIPVVDWTDSDLLMRNFTAAGGSSETPSCKFCVQSYGLSCADLPRVQTRALKEVGFLYADYQSACWYWESAELGRKLVLTSILTLIAPGSAGQVLVGLLIAFFMLVLNLRLRPYADSGLNSMNALSQYNLFFFLLVALLLKVNLDGDTSKDFFSYIVGVLTVVPVVLPVLIRIYLRLGGFGAQGKEMKRVFSDGLRAD